MTTAIRFGPTALRRLLAAFVCGWLGTSSVSAGDVRVSPPSVALTGPEASQQVLITLVGAGGPAGDPRGDGPRQGEPRASGPLGGPRRSRAGRDRVEAPVQGGPPRS